MLDSRRKRDRTRNGIPLPYANDDILSIAWIVGGLRKVSNNTSLGQKLKSSTRSSKNCSKNILKHSNARCYITTRLASFNLSRILHGNSVLSIPKRISDTSEDTGSL